MSSTPSSDQQNNNLLVTGQGFNSGTSSVSLFAAQPQKQQPDQQQQQFFGVPHQLQAQQQFYQQSASSIGQSQQFYTQPYPGQHYTSQRSIQSQQFVQMPHQQPQQMFYHPQGGQQPQYSHQMGADHSQQQFYAGHAQQIAAAGIETQEEEIIVEDEEEAPSMVVGETCTVETSFPSPDFANEEPPQLAQQSYYGQGQEQRIVMATMAQQQQSSTAPSMGSAVVAQPMMSRAPASAYYGQQVHPKAHPPQPRFIIMSTAYPRSPHQQIGQQQRPNHNLLHTQHQTPAGHIIRRTTPFEEEEEEEDEEEDEDEDEEEEEQQIGRQPQQASSNNRLHTLKLPQIGQSLADTKIEPQMQPSVNVDEPRMTRAGRRKQIFEKSAKMGSGRKGSTEGSRTNPSDETMVKKTSNVTPPKRENIQQQTRPILDKGIVHIQAIQRLATPEGWRRMNDWLKGAIKTMDLAKLRQLMVQLTDADISVDLLRANDTPKLIKDLQKCADKDIANMATKMVTKWKQSVREGNNSEKQKQQQKATAKTGIIEKEQTTGAATKDATTGKHLRRSSQSMDSDGGNGQSTSSNAPQKGGTNAVQTRGRISSITGASTSGSAQQQIGTRANSFGSASGGQAIPTTTEKPKTAAKAKAKISRPRLTGLEGDDDTAKPPPSTKPAPLTKRLSGTGKSSTSPTTAISESPLTKIMAATAKFQAQQQPKRKPVDVIFSDDFMDSLSAADNVKPKKPKIVRRKLNPLPGTGNGAASTVVGSSGGKNDLVGGLTDASADPSVLNSSGGGNENSGRRRVRFVDEIMGRELVSVRHFEIEEGERINVTKLDKEQIKHFDSQQEKMLLMNSGFGRRPGPGGPALGVSGTFSSLTDPSLMPPGHGRRLFDMPMAQTSTAVGPGMQPPPPMRAPFAVMSDKKWKLIPVTHKPLIEPGNKSESKEIELERQKTTIPLPISDLDEQELKRHREESLSHMPKIIPMELVTEVVEQKGAGMTIQQAKIETKEKEELGSEEPMEIVEEADKKMGIKAKVEKMEEDIRLPISPARPQVSRMSSSDESEEDKMDVEMDDGLKKEQEGREDLIASPEPEHLDASMDDSTDSIKEIPIEKIRSSTEEDEEEDLDIRDIPQQQQMGCRLETPKSSTPISAVTSSASIQEILKKNSHLIPMLKNLNTTLGSQEGQSPMVVGQPQQQQISPQQSSVAAGSSLTPPQQQPVMSLQEARNVAGICNYFMRHNKCDYGDKCKFAHDESTITLGVQMAMRGVNIGGGRGGMRGGLRGRGGFVGGPGRGGNTFRMGADGGNGSAGQSGGFDDRRRRGGGFGSGGGGRDYDLSPIRDGGGNVGKGGGTGYRDRRFRQQQSSRPKYSSRSRSRDRYSRRRQSRSRSRSREHSDRDRSNRDRRRSRSASKSSSRFESGRRRQSRSRSRSRERSDRDRSNRDRRRSRSASKSSSSSIGTYSNSDSSLLSSDE